MNFFKLGLAVIALAFAIFLTDWYLEPDIADCAPPFSRPHDQGGFSIIARNACPHTVIMVSQVGGGATLTQCAPGQFCEIGKTLPPMPDLASTVCLNFQIKDGAEACFPLGR